MVEEKILSATIVVCTRNRSQDLKNLCLSSIANLKYPDIEVIVVDDASTDETPFVVDGFRGKIKKLWYVFNDKNIGLSYVRNLGIDQATGDIIAFIDDDCKVQESWLENIIKPFIEDEEIIAVGGKSYLGDTEEVYAGEGNIWGCNMAFRRNIFNRYRFDTNLYFNKCSWYDETELLQRLKDDGFKLKYQQDANLRHYLKPAEYRKNAQIGAALNLIYMMAKKTPLKKYYMTVLRVFAKGMLPWETGDTIAKGVDCIRGAFSPKRYSLWIFLPKSIFHIFLTIPLKAKIKTKKDKLMRAKLEIIHRVAENEEA